MLLALLLLLGSPLLFTLAKFVALVGLTERSHQLFADDRNNRTRPYAEGRILRPRHHNPLHLSASSPSSPPSCART